MLLCSIPSAQVDRTPLHGAAIKGHSEVIARLLARGANTMANDEVRRRELGLVGKRTSFFIIEQVERIKLFECLNNA